MADAHVVSTKLEQIEQYHGELLSKQQLSKEAFLHDITERRAVERMFEILIQACADLAKHIASQDFEYAGDSSKGAIEVLTEHGVLDEATGSTLVTAIGFRNILSHEYGQVDAELVYEYLQDELAVYDRFSQQVAAWFEDQAL